MYTVLMVCGVRWIQDKGRKCQQNSFLCNFHYKICHFKNLDWIINNVIIFKSFIQLYAYVHCFEDWKRVQDKGGKW